MSLEAQIKEARSTQESPVNKLCDKESSCKGEEFDIYPIRQEALSLKEELQKSQED